MYITNLTTLVLDHWVVAFDVQLNYDQIKDYDE